MSGCVSWRRKYPAKILMSSKPAHIKFGSKYGNVLKIPLDEKMLGNVIVGSAKVPPMAGPIMVPMLQTNGMTEYARAEEK